MVSFSIENDNPKTLPADILAKAKVVRLLGLDVDGVLSDGRLYFNNLGEEIKSFHTLDGQGIKMIQQSGIAVAIITGRKSTIVAQRAKEINIEHIIQGCENKLDALNTICSTLDIPLHQTAFMGDDLPDLACIKACHLGITVPQGHYFVKQHADIITQSMGGFGAVREICELIMQSQGHLDQILQKHLK